METPTNDEDTNIDEFNVIEEELPITEDECFAETKIDEFIQHKFSSNARALTNFFKSNINFLAEKDEVNIINLSPKRSYSIPDVSMEDFFDLLEKCRLEKVGLHYMEKQAYKNHNKSGIMIDFDRWQRSKAVQISEGHFEKLARVITKMLSDYIDFTEYAKNDKFMFHMFFIRKPAIVSDPNKTINGVKGFFKDGFHILIPEIQVIKGFKRFLLNELKPRMQKIFSDIDHVVPAEEMLDMCSAANPVFFYGSSKLDKPTYVLTHAYRMSIDVTEDDIDRKTIDADDLNKGFYKPSPKDEPFALNMVYELSLAFYQDSLVGLPTWLVKRGYDYRINFETKIQLIAEKTHNDVISEDDILGTENSISILSNGDAEAKFINNLLELLDISYAVEYHKWFKVICAIAHTSVNYKPLAIAFSHRKPESWNPTEFERVWNEAVNGRGTQRNPVTKKSLMYWAEQCNKAKYKEIKDQNYIGILNNYVYNLEGSLEHAHVAKVLYAMIGDKFIVDVGERGGKGEDYMWYEFMHPGQSMTKGEVYKWRRELTPDNIHLYLSDHMPKIYETVIGNLKGRRENITARTEEEGKQHSQHYLTIEKSLKKSMRNLGNMSYQRGVVQAANYRFRQRGFHQQLDAYENIMGVGNGIIKLGPKVELIKGFHEYKISKYTDVDFVPFDPEKNEVKILLQAFRDIFPEPDVFEFMMMYASTGLDRREAACIIMLLTGGGNNGKSFFLKMINNTIGNQYCSTLKPSLLTSPSESGDRANSAHMQLKGINIGYFDEFNKAEVLNPARLKSIVSPGWQTGRELHKKQEVFKVTANLVVASNYQFIIDCIDHGMWRRIRYYKNKVKFTAFPNPDNPYEKKENRDFIYKYADDTAYKQAFLSILTYYYEMLMIKYGGDLKNIPCPTIDRETEEYRNSQDAVNKFVTELIVKSPSSVDIPIAEVAKRYINWYSVNVRGGVNQTIIEVTSCFENSRIAGSLVRKIDGQFLKGHRLRNSIDEPLQDGEEYLAPIFAEKDPVEKNDLPACPETNSTDREQDSYIKEAARSELVYQDKSFDNIFTQDINIQELDLL